MSYQEKRALVSLIGTILISAFYLRAMFERYGASNFSVTDEFQFWAAVILIYIPVSTFLKVLIHVIFSVINTVATREEEPSITDERDRLIDLKSTRNFYHVFMAGFLLALAALAFGLPPVTMFLMVIASMVIAGTILDLSQIYYYRRGV